MEGGDDGSDLTSVQRQPIQNKSPLYNEHILIKMRKKNAGRAQMGLGSLQDLTDYG
jgi:hypothetical protein